METPQDKKEDPKIKAMQAQIKSLQDKFKLLEGSFSCKTEDTDKTNNDKDLRMRRRDTFQTIVLKEGCI